MNAEELEDRLESQYEEVARMSAEIIEWLNGQHRRRREAKPTAKTPDRPNHINPKSINLWKPRVRNV